jgi:23S rRNA maturation mini-RNase III
MLTATVGQQDTFDLSLRPKRLFKTARGTISRAQKREAPVRSYRWAAGFEAVLSAIVTWA